ncbi:MAG TPA: ArdC family protein [Clostridia bacterium]|nr:ArdC family protein [Clostridia bacterium]
MSEQQKDPMQEITDRLEKGISELFQSDQYKQYLTTMSKFHNYSLNNTILILLQKPDASLIAGFRGWQEQFSRNVMKGEKSIKILAPCPIKKQIEMEVIDPDTQRPILDDKGSPVRKLMDITIPRFKIVSVFDVSQTEGKPLPSLGTNELTGSVEHFPAFFKAIQSISPYPIFTEQIDHATKGYCNYAERRIVIKEGMGEAQMLKTAIHELSHAVLHGIYHDASTKLPPELRKDRNTREVEAESVAFTVCQYFGVDTSDYSFGYIAGWSSGRELKELKASLELIRATSSDIISRIEQTLQPVRQEELETIRTAPAQRAYIQHKQRR